MLSTNTATEETLNSLVSRKKKQADKAAQAGLLEKGDGFSFPMPKGVSGSDIDFVESELATLGYKFRTAVVNDELCFVLFPCGY